MKFVLVHTQRNFFYNCFNLNRLLPSSHQARTMHCLLLRPSVALIRCLISWIYNFSEISRHVCCPKRNEVVNPLKLHFIQAILQVEVSVCARVGIKAKFFLLLSEEFVSWSRPAEGKGNTLMRRGQLPRVGMRLIYVGHHDYHLQPTVDEEGPPIRVRSRSA